jgi:hypothetical protein
VYRETREQKEKVSSFSDVLDMGSNR